MSFDLLERIDKQTPGFTKTLSLIASYVKKEYLRIPFLSIQEMSKECGVSATSVHRFCISLGYLGYSELQKEIQNLVQQDFITKETQIYQDSGIEESGVLKYQIDSNIRVLQEMYTPDLNANFLKAAQKIKAGRKIYILGLRESYSVAFYLFQLLGEYMDNVQLLSLGVGDLYDRIATICEEDVLVAIGFKPYMKQIVEIIRYFRSKNATAIVMTDLHTSPLAVHANINLIPGNTTPSFGFVMAVTAIKALSIEVLHLYEKKEIEAISQQKENLLDKEDLFLP